MALLHTPQNDLRWLAPDFKLTATDEATYTYNQVAGPNGTVIAFICNHCPYVRAIIDRLVADLENLKEDGIGAAAIMPNDTLNYPEDSFENMQNFAVQHNFGFPYLLDETQDVARACNAVCTPDIFGFDSQARLKYRGRLDSAGSKSADGSETKDLVNAMRMIAETGDGPEEQSPSMGCSIKWR